MSLCIFIWLLIAAAVVAVIVVVIIVVKKKNKKENKWDLYNEKTVATAAVYSILKAMEITDTLKGDHLMEKAVTTEHIEVLMPTDFNNMNFFEFN